jgi:hypothetical protein
MERFFPPDQGHFDTPTPIRSEYFDDPAAAVARLEQIYDAHTGFLRDKFQEPLRGGTAASRPRDLSAGPAGDADLREDRLRAYGHASAPAPTRRPSRARRCSATIWRTRSGS